MLRWIPPPQGVLKVNVDAALSKNSDTAAVAAVARDETGMFLGASALVVEGITSPEVAEAMACREGLALASDLDLQKIRIVTECVNVVKSIHGKVWDFMAISLGRSRQGRLGLWTLSSFTKVGILMVMLIN